MKKYLFIALALLGMASCAKDDLNGGNKPQHNGEIEESYIAINLMAADSGTRAQDLDNEKDGGYEDGTPAEREVKTAYFFFFDENGNPFNVVNAPATAPGGEKVASNTHDNVFDTKKQPDMFITLGDLQATPVYVELLGWELFNDYNDSYLLKKINPAWTEGIGFNWNDSNFFRSYWAISQDTALDDKFTWQYTSDKQDEKGFKTEYGFDVASDVTYTDDKTYTYCGENTNQVVLDGEGKVTSDPRTKVILKGQLLKSNGTGGHEALELASWYGNEYAGTDNLLTAVANSLAYTLFHSTDQTNFYPIKKEDLECDITVAGTKSYETGFKLSAEGKTKVWYKYSSDDKHQPMALISDLAAVEAATNTYLAENVKPAIIYVNGMTYYIVDVEHLGADNSDTQYGVVRNHVYQIDINSIKGYGSPIYSGKEFIVEQPDYPETQKDSYVAARINVLSWKIVKQTVDIVQ